MELPKSFWAFNIGHLGTLIALAFSVGGFYFSQGQLRKDHDMLAIEVRLMDERGTRASQKGIYQESEQSKANERRLLELEREWHEVGPKVERIDVNLQWLLKAQGVTPQK